MTCSAVKVQILELFVSAHDWGAFRLRIICPILKWSFLSAGEDGVDSRLNMVLGHLIPAWHSRHFHHFAVGDLLILCLYLKVCGESAIHFPVLTIAPQPA